MTYDLRVQTAANFAAPAATNLAFVAVDEDSIAAVKSGRLGYSYGLPWPRQVYGRLIDELSAEGAKAIGFDVLFPDLDHDQSPVQMADGRLVESDDFFALQMRRAGNVILATTPETVLPGLFATNALALGDISSIKDSDGVFRRAQAFCTVRRWHPFFLKIASDPEWGVDLGKAQVTPGKIILPQTGTTNVFEVPVDADNNFNLSDFVGDKLPPGMPAKARAFTDERVWHLGIVLAAQELKLDLSNAMIDLSHGKITLHGMPGVERVIPVDAKGTFLVNWQLNPNDPRITRASVENLLWRDKMRLTVETNGLRDDFHGKLPVVIYAVQANNLTDEGATPLDKHTLLAGVHWNVANSVITGQFVRRAPGPVELALILLCGVLVALLAWELRAFSALAGTLAFAFVYIGFAFWAYLQFRFWMPLVFPLAAMFGEYVSLVTYRVVFEEREQRRVKSVFSRIVSPEVMNELLRAERLSLGGARREVSVFFADVRGFTTFTDEMQERVLDFIREHKLDDAAAEKCVDESAREMLETVNLYLATVADAVKNHGGTLDKYIGDCVMAFWNAPISNEKHALHCVRAAIEAQRAIYDLNRKRLAQNASREIENRARLSAGLPPKPVLTSLQLGTGINTGFVTVGLMGSETHQSNYTVFGREVNLASRLESVSGSGRIIISEATLLQLKRHDPALAGTCVELPPVNVKGIRAVVRIYEAPWHAAAPQ